MTLRELKNRIDYIAEHKDGKFIDYDVVVTLADKDIAGRAFSHITNLFVGSGTEYGQVRVELRDEVCIKGKAKKDRQKLVVKSKGRFSKPLYRCPRCGAKAEPHFSYCCHCGQRVYIEGRNNGENKD